MDPRAAAQGSRSRRPADPPVPRLHVIAGDDVVATEDGARRLLELAEACGPALAIQLRARASTAKRIHDVARRLAEAGGACVLVSDRLDVALAAGAHGVHLREDSMPVTDARALVDDLGRSHRPGRRFLVGRSIHSPRQASETWAAATDYLVLGAVWPTPSHPGRAAVGTEALAQVAGHARVPALAIGGVTPERVAAAKSAGAWGVVVRSGVWSAKHPSEAVIRYLDALGEA